MYPLKSMYPSKDIALNVFFNSKDRRQILQDYISPHNFTRSKQLILLKITDGVKWHFQALESIKQTNNTFKPSKFFQD